MRLLSKGLGLGVILSFLLTACLKPEKPWKLPERGEGFSLTGVLGPEYDTVAFVSLREGRVHRVARTAWDLELVPISEGYAVWLNGAMYAWVVVLDSTTWASVSDPSGLTGWCCDLPDTPAVGSLVIGERRYLLLDRDRSEAFYRGTSRYAKLLLACGNNEVEVKAWSLGGQLLGEWRFLRSAQRLYLSLERSGDTVRIRPPWPFDFVLTRYIHYYPDQPEAFRYYPVVGALLGEGRRAALVSTSSKPYEAFTYQDLSLVTFSARRDAIGFDWKTYNFDTGTYVIDFSRFYILEAEGLTYYKLRFVDFYDEAGRKGTVRFVYEPL